MMPEMFLSLTDRLLKNLEKSKEESCGLTIFHFSDCFTFFLFLSFVFFCSVSIVLHTVLSNNYTKNKSFRDTKKGWENSANTS
jgi:hypothetical protein